MTIYSPEITLEVKKFLKKLGVIITDNCVHLMNNELDILSVSFGLDVSLYDFFDVKFITKGNGQKYFICYHRKYNIPFYINNKNTFFTHSKFNNPIISAEYLKEQLVKCQKII